MKQLFPKTRLRIRIGSKSPSIRQLTSDMLDNNDFNLRDWEEIKIKMKSLSLSLPQHVMFISLLRIERSVVIWDHY